MSTGTAATGVRRGRTRGPAGDDYPPPEGGVPTGVTKRPGRARVRVRPARAASLLAGSRRTHERCRTPTAAGSPATGPARRRPNPAPTGWRAAHGTSRRRCRVRGRRCGPQICTTTAATSGEGGSSSTSADSPGLCARGSHDGVERAVEGHPGADAADRPQQACVATVLAETREQVVAELRSLRRRHVLEARQQAHRFALDLRRLPLRLLAADAELRTPAARTTRSAGLASVLPRGAAT